MKSVNFHTNSTILTVIAAFTLHFLSFSPYGELPHYLAICSSLVVFYTIFSMVLKRELENIFLLTFLILNWTYFLSPYLLENKTSYFMRIIKEEYISEISLFSAFSIVLIYVGYKFTFNDGIKPLSSAKIQFKPNILKKLTFYFIAAGSFYRIGLMVSPFLFLQLSNIVQVLFYAPTITITLYVLYLLRTKSYPQISFFHIVTIGYIGAEFLIRLSSTLFASVLILFVGAVFVYFREKKKIPVTLLLVASILLIPLYQTRKYFRLNKEKGTPSYAQISKGTGYIKDILDDNIQDEVEELNNKKNRFNKGHNRFENLSFISHVVLQHKLDVKPFLFGTTFYWLPIVPIPRIIFPWKPENIMSTEVATSYGLRGIVSKASINFPMLVEAYINFGFYGMLIMSFLFGATFKWFAMKFGLGLGDLNLIIVINAFKQFMHAEGNITLVFGALIQVYIFWRIIIWYFKVNERFIDE